MKDCVDVATNERGRNCRVVAKVNLGDFGVGMYRRAVATLEAIQRDHLVPMLERSLDCNRANIPTRARNQYPHAASNQCSL
jgi:hypothetical protein